MRKIAGSGSASGSGSESGSICQRHGSADPDPHENAMDPQHWLSVSLISPLLTLSYVSGHSLLPYQQIPEPNMPHNVSFNTNGYPGPHSPFSPHHAAPQSPLSLPSPASSISGHPGEFQPESQIRMNSHYFWKLDPDPVPH
jgi:hypothetical protein